MAPTTIREYDIVVLGATGYTASIVAEYVTKNLQTGLKWAVAGRSESKLQDLVTKLKAINGDRREPGIEIIQLDRESLGNLASKACIIINGIGPYHLYSTPVVEACARAGTHYVGFSLETPWIEEIIKKHHEIAKENGSIIIPTIALAPSDVVAYLVASKIQKQPKSLGTAEVNSTAKLGLQGMSGGSLSTVLNLMATYGISWIIPGNPWSLTSTPKSHPTSSIPILSRIFGYRSLPGLGMVTTSFLAIANESIGHRSSSLQPGIYGPEFHYHEYLPVSNLLAAVLVHFFTRTVVILLALSPIRLLFKKIIPHAGTGPDLAAAEVEKQIFVAIGNPTDPDADKVRASFAYEGSLYYCSAMMGVEAALVILGNEVTAAHEYGGGILTPAMLGMPFVESVKKKGIKITVETIA